MVFGVTIFKHFRIFCKIKTFKTSKRPSSCLRIIPETGGHNKLMKVKISKMT